LNSCGFLLISWYVIIGRPVFQRGLEDSLARIRLLRNNSSELTKEGTSCVIAVDKTAAQGGPNE